MWVLCQDNFELQVTSYKLQVGRHNVGMDGNSQSRRDFSYVEGWHSVDMDGNRAVDFFKTQRKNRDHRDHRDS